MRSRGWRSRRHEGAPAGVDGEPVDLASDDHAWWAARDDVHAVPRGTQGSSRRRGSRTADAAPSGDQSHRVFQDYYTRESLFEAPLIELRSAQQDPYRVLGVPESASWPEISTAHRRLAMEHHPDRLSSATAEQRAISARFMCDINIAYMELRRRRGC